MPFIWKAEKPLFNVNLHIDMEILIQKIVQYTKIIIIFPVHLIRLKNPACIIIFKFHEALPAGFPYQRHRSCLRVPADFSPPVEHRAAICECNWEEACILLVLSFIYSAQLYLGPRWNNAGPKNSACLPPIKAPPFVCAAQYCCLFFFFKYFFKIILMCFNILISKINFKK